MKSENKLSIAKQFSAFPAGRIQADGPFNGEKFRKEMLLPNLKEAESEGGVLVISLDGLKSCGSSFLESAFGGLIRYEGYTKAQLDRLMRVETESPSLERYRLSIQNHVKRARPE